MKEKTVNIEDRIESPLVEPLIEAKNQNTPKPQKILPPKSDSEHLSLADKEMQDKIIRKNGKWVLDLMLEAIPNPLDYRGNQAIHLAYALKVVGKKRVLKAVRNPKEDLLAFVAPLLLKEEEKYKIRKAKRNAAAI
jgi:hypothetical protein